MKLYAPLLVIGLLVLAACGDDDEPNDNTPPGSSTQTGRFGPGFGGVRYTTATKSGLTGTTGEFDYEDGERVTFTLGAVALGSANAANVVNLFDIVGVSAPTDATNMVREIGDDLHQPWERAVTIAMFLLAMDADGNPSNGVDLTGRDEQLAGIEVNLLRSPSAFLYQDGASLAARIPHYAMYVFDDSIAIAYIYRVTGIALSGKATVRSDLGGADEGYYTTATYDQNGCITKTANGFDGEVNSETTDVYDSGLRKVIETSQRNPNGAGGFDDVFTYTNTYAPNGALQSTTSTDNERTTTDAHTYNSAGLLERSTRTATAEQPQTDSYTWDATARTVTMDHLVQQEVGYFGYREVKTFDERGRVATVQQWNYDGVTVTDELLREEYTYDANDRVLTHIRNDNNSVRTTAITYSYDNWHVTRVEERTDNGNDNVIDLTIVRDVEYANDQRTKLTVTRTDEGQPSYVTEVTTWSYDASNHATGHVSAYSNAAGPTGSDTGTFTLDAEGNVTRREYNGDWSESFTLESTANPVTSTLQFNGKRS